MRTVIALFLFIDTFMPTLLHDPIYIIRFHVYRASSLYSEAVSYTKSDPKEAIKLAIRAQNHLSHIEENIRKLQRWSDVPYENIQQTLKKTEKDQQTLLADLPESYAPAVRQLESFEFRTETVIKKLYYESLLP